MSLDAIRSYYREVEDIKHRGGTAKETAIRTAFHKLIDTYARSRDLRLVTEISITGRKNKTVIPDGTLKDNLRLDWGYWESKDEADDLETEIQKKFDKGYPNDNILFEDGNSAVLYWNGIPECRAAVKNEAELDKLLKAFINYQRPEVAEFRKAIELFKNDIPKITSALRDMILEKAEQNKTYINRMNTFLTLCKEVINPNITKEDIREMVIQHILTADIFNTIFDEPHFHRENNIACELQNLVDTFFTREIREKTLAGIKHYYDTINAKAAQIADHHEKQMFLKVVYETFYKSYDPKKADRLGVVYTPGEIVRFMIDSTDYLLQKHFGRQLQDKNVEILDPATGTGTFICDIIDHIAKDKLPYKYAHELHANEVEILPYYIANLNIEFTYKQKMGDYKEFENLCFVDTLDNMGFDYKGKQADIFSVTDENAERIKRQNEKKISVIIGNPPYNANQMNANEQNKNRPYDIIDKRIKDTYIKHSNAQMTKVYDMYSRFYRWAMDRLSEDGIIAFITNRSFIDSRTFDGFRKIISDEFDFCYIVDTKSDVRQNPKIAGTTHNVFGIQTGVAIMFLVKQRNDKKLSKPEFKLPSGNVNSKQTKGQFGLRDATNAAELKSETPQNTKSIKNTEGVLNSFSALPANPCRIYYTAMEDDWRKEDKLQWLTQQKINYIDFELIQPDKDNNWINLSDNDWDDLPCIADDSVRDGSNSKAVFKQYSLGLNSARDEWTFDTNMENLSKKMKFYIDFYNKEKSRWDNTNRPEPISDFVERSIKWHEELENHIRKGTVLEFHNERIRKALYRPYSKLFHYYDKVIVHRLFQLNSILPIDKPQKENLSLCLSGVASTKPFTILCTDTLYDIHLTGDSQGFSLYRYDTDGNRQDNITDWALAEFQKHYKHKNISKEDIFHYVYGVLHNPAYRAKYEQNLKRSLPRIPYYEDFCQWAQWGKKLMELHLNYETVTPYPLEILTTEHTEKTENTDTDKRKENLATLRLGVNKTAPKAKLKADKENGKIILDTQTTLSGIPSLAWEYKLGNRSALEWILDQYKEKKPKDPTIAKLFNTYRFADYKEQVIDLLMRVTTVSVETMKIVREMEKND